MEPKSRAFPKVNLLSRTFTQHLKKLHVNCTLTGSGVLLERNSTNQPNLRRAPAPSQVLDSANKLSERDLRQVGLITDSLRSDVQTLLFTSGYDSAVHEITRKWLKDPVQRVAADESPVALW